MELTVRDIRRHTLSFDLEFSRLTIIIDGLNNAIRHLYDSELCMDWWGCMDEKHECETIYRLAILAFESYITSSSASLCNENEDPQKFYDLLPEVILVLALSKYITSNSGNYKKDFALYHLDVNDYPIYHGIKLLNKDRKLTEITKILKSWRNQIVYIQYPVDTDD
jgi:hypothetical protein